MLYTREQFESIPADDLLANHRRWISGNGPGNKYVAHEIRFAFWLDHLICIGWTMREGVQGIDEDDRKTNVITEVNFLHDKPFAHVERLVPPNKHILVLRPEFEPEPNDIG